MSNKYRRQNLKPKKVNGQEALTTAIYREELFQTVKGLFSVEMPDEWDYDYLMTNFLRAGVIAICDSPIGVNPFVCSTFGENYMNLATKIKVAVPTLMSFERTIGVDCELLYMERLVGKRYFTFWNLIDIYAYKLAAIDAAIDMNLFNSRTAYVAEAETRAQAETYKEAYDRISEGEPLVVYRKDSMNPRGLNLFFNNIKNNFITTELQDARRTTYNEFLTRIGINNANTDKRERLVTSEVKSNNMELLVNTAVIAKNIERCIERIHKMFPELRDTFNMRLEYRDRLEKEDRQNDTRGSNRMVGDNAPEE